MGDPDMAGSMGRPGALAGIPPPLPPPLPPLPHLKALVHALSSTDLSLTVMMPIHMQGALMQ